MSMKYLGQTFDIHTGGVDNIFPHHENEIAQSEGATGKPFVNYWLHCEHLLWGNTKMSKSLGNIIYIKGLVEKGYSPPDIRYTLLTTHYRQKLNFSLEMLDASKSTLKRLRDFLADLEHFTNGELSPEVKNSVDKMMKDFEKSMDDDLNVSPAVAAIFTSIKEINRIKRERTLTEEDKEYIKKAINRLNRVLGIFYLRPMREFDVSEDFILQKIAERNEARANKNWALADKIRNELDAMGVELLDRKDGTGFKIKN